MKFTCIVIDVDLHAHKDLRNHMQKIDNVELVGAFFTFEDARRFLNDNTPDIILADVNMSDRKGKEFLQSVPACSVVIVSTAHREYAFEGFEFGVIDYLLKPLVFERFNMAIRRAIEFLRMERLFKTIEFEHEASDERFEIQVRSGLRRLLIDFRTITHAQGLKDYTILFTSSSKYLVKGSIKKIEELLPPDYFLRVHKSFIVARSRIKVLTKNKIDLGHTLVPIGRIYKPKVDEFFDRHPLPLLKSNHKIDIWIVDDDEFLRKSYANIVNSSDDFWVSQTFRGIEDLLVSLESNPPPGIILMDIGLAGMNGVEGTRIVKGMFPNIIVIMVTVFDDSDLVFDSLKAGASGYITKTSNYIQLLKAIAEIAAGGAPMSSKIARMVIDSFHSEQQLVLTTREASILQLVASGKTFSQVSVEVGITKNATQLYLREIYRKLEVTGKDEAIIKATRERLI